MCDAAGERLDVERLRVVPVDPVADAAQPREVPEVLCRRRAGHVPDAATDDGCGQDANHTAPVLAQAPT